MKTKTVDCVEMKRRGLQRVANLSDGRIVEEQLNNRQRETRESLKRKKSVRL
jgi:hypothetical protein